MCVLDKLTVAEARDLFWQFAGAVGEVNAEISHLERCPPFVRAELYGQGTLEAYYGLRDELVGILTDDLTVFATHHTHRRF